MTEERTQGAPERVPNPPESAFSESREWKPCPQCGGGDPYERFFGDARAFAADPCPTCGQPPRCMIGVKAEDSWCPRPATADMTGVSQRPNVCGQHYAVNDIRCELQEWEHALEHLGAFLQTAGLLGMGGGVLADLLRSVRAEAEAKIAGLEAEIARIWEGS